MKNMEERIRFMKYVLITKSFIFITLSISKNKQLPKSCGFKAHSYDDYGDWKTHSGFCLFYQLSPQLMHLTVLYETERQTSHHQLPK